MKAIDDEEVLNYYFDDRETFVVDYDPKLVWVDIDIKPGEVVFRLNHKLKEVRKCRD